MALITLDDLEARAAVRYAAEEAAAKAGWRALVETVAYGGKIDEAAALAILAALNKTPADVRTAADRLTLQRSFALSRLGI